MGGLPMVGGGIGAVVIALLALFFRGTPGEIAIPQEQSGPAAGAPAPGQDAEADWVSALLKDTELTWHEVFRAETGKEYVEPKLVLFSNIVQSSCGTAQSATGPFYCPLDGKVYIDLSFYRELKERFRAPGDFAQAYVIAHEVGHHVQNLLGTLEEVHNAQQQSGRRGANVLSVKNELQADCFAGVWAHHSNKTRGTLEEGDVEEGLNAATAIGDDRLQRETRGYVTPDSFTHGSSAQRVRWFKRGLQSGRMADCDTFRSPEL